jgi:hypothetical protein
MVKNFSIECDAGIAVCAGHGLIARLQVDDLQPDGSERNIPGVVNPVLIRAAVQQGKRGSPDSLPADNTIPVGKTRHSAQDAILPVRSPLKGNRLRSGEQV